MTEREAGSYYTVHAGLTVSILCLHFQNVAIPGMSHTWSLFAHTGSKVIINTF